MCFNGLRDFMVRVTGFEPAASWTPFKRDTKLRHTRIFTFQYIQNISVHKRSWQQIVCQLLLWIWSEWLDSNQRPLEPHSSAIPNFATPGYLIVIASGDFDMIAQLPRLCKCFFEVFQNFLSVRLILLLLPHCLRHSGKHRSCTSAFSVTAQAARLPKALRPGWMRTAQSLFFSSIVSAFRLPQIFWKISVFLLTFLYTRI